jgi:hypothetical protein
MALAASLKIDRNSLLYAVKEELSGGLGQKNFSSAELLSIAQGPLRLKDEEETDCAASTARGTYYNYDVDWALDRLPWKIVMTERMWVDDYDCFGMENGIVTIPVRRALLYYAWKRLGLDTEPSARR